MPFEEYLAAVAAAPAPLFGAELTAQFQGTENIPRESAEDLEETATGHSVRERTGVMSHLFLVLYLAVRHFVRGLSVFFSGPG